jgi:MSHA pilin protein MshD
MFIKPARLLQRGISLVELIVFIVIISTALLGILSVMNITTSHSADPLVHKQALAIAESLLEEVELKPFTYCDPDDASAVTAASAAVGAGGCNALVEALGPEGAETRLGAVQFDNVNDYAGMAPLAAGTITDIAGNNIGVGGYNATIGVEAVPLNGIVATDANGAPQVLHITVTVTGPDGVPIMLDGYRTRFSPTGVP